MDSTPKNQVVERLRSAQNVLITVSNDPSVDQLSAAIGFTLLMNKLGKHATAVFSGQVPPAIDFLKPTDTLEQTTDSLRDFIIALDKSKADKLRYKVEEDVVKIFITPYKTSLSEKDLEFSQGDFNVDVVVALGVDQQEHIDQAIAAHGRILHDATVIGVMAAENALDIGGINWQDPTASSLCEMLVSISEAFGNGLLDTQMSTAFLTGIVAETNRFSNEKTTPKVMTMSAQLMAAGANQQLISNKLEIPETPAESQAPADLPAPTEEKSTTPEGEIDLHPPVDPPLPVNQNEIDIDREGTLRHAEELAKLQEEKAAQEKAEQTTDEVEQSEPEESEGYSKFVSEPPTTGGTLTANTQPEDGEDTIDPLSSEFEAEQQPGVGQEHRIEPLGPKFGDNEDLDQMNIGQIEKSVKDFEAGVAKEQTPDLDSARKAVEEAATAFNPERPEPVQDLGAQLIPEADQDQSVPGAPPLVPPPIPLPLPKNADQQDDKNLK